MSNDHHGNWLFNGIILRSSSPRADNSTYVRVVWSMESCILNRISSAPRTVNDAYVQDEKGNKRWSVDKMDAAVYSEIMILMGLKYAGDGSVGMGEVANLEVEWGWRIQHLWGDVYPVRKKVVPHPLWYCISMVTNDADRIGHTSLTMHDTDSSVDSSPHCSALDEWMSIVE